jgi:hypothetical protein
MTLVQTMVNKQKNRRIKEGIHQPPNQQVPAQIGLTD